MDIVLKLLGNFFEIYNESAVYLLLGLLFAGLSHQYLAADFIKKHLNGRSIWTNLKASIVGTPVPLCSCGVVPVGLELKRKGLSTSATASFLVATPENGVDSILLTQGFFGGTFTILRVSFSIALANLVGFAVGLSDKFTSKEEKVENSDSEISCCSRDHSHSHGHSHAHDTEKQDATDYILDTFMPDLIPWLMTGFALSALITSFIPSDFFQSMNAGTGVIAAAFVGIPLYVCASASTPIAYSLLLNGLSPGAVFVFLLTGPATNSSNIPLYVRELGLKQTISFYLSLFLGSIAIGFLINSFDLDLASHITHHTHEHSSNSIVNILGTVAFTSLIFWSYYRRYEKTRSKKDSCCGS